MRRCGWEGHSSVRPELGLLGKTWTERTKQKNIEDVNVICYREKRVLRKIRSRDDSLIKGWYTPPPQK